MTIKDEGDLKARLISGAKWTAVLRASTQAVSWLVTIIVVRFLTPQDYGLNAMLEVPIEFLMLFSTLGVEMALIQRREISKEEIAAVFGALMVLNGTFFVLVFLGAGWVATYYHEPRLVPLLQVASVIFLLSPLRTIPNALLDRALEFKLRAQVDMQAMAVASALCLALAVSGAGVWALVAALVTNFALRSIILAYRSPWLVRPSLDFARVMPLFYFGGMITLSGAILIVAGKSVSLIAGPVLGAEMLGYYAVAAEFAHLPMSKVMPIVQQTMYPAYSKLQDRTAAAGTYLLKSLELSALVMFPMLIGMACVSANFVAVVFGEKWLPMAMPLALFAAITPARMVAQVCYPALNALGHAKAVLTINLAMLVLLASGAFLMRGAGLMALVAIWMVAVPCTTALALLFVRRLVGVSIGRVAKAVTPAITASLSMAIPLLCANALMEGNGGVLRLLTEISAGAALYVISIFVFHRRLFDEIRSHLLVGR